MDIGECILSGCSLVSLKIENRTAIPAHSFENCGLDSKKLEIPDGVRVICKYAFKGCGFTSVGLSSELSTIEEGAFEDTGLESVTIPKSVGSIGNCAFSGCAKLTKIDVADDSTFFKSDNGVLLSKDGTKLYQLPPAADRTEYTVGEDVDWIGEKAFAGCKNLVAISVHPYNEKYVSENGALMTRDNTLVAFPAGYDGACYVSGVSKIGDYAFHGCNLTRLSINIITATDLNIGKHAFDGCRHLKDVSINWYSIVIGEYAFSGCTSLEEVRSNEIRVKNIAIGDHAFDGCDGFKGIYNRYGDEVNVNSIGEYAFRGCKALASIKLSDGLTEVKSHCFDGCTGLKSFAFNKITVIGEYAFCGCTGLTQASLAGGIKLGEGAFQDCKALTEVVLPDSVTEIPDYAFDGCKCLRTIDLSRIAKIGDYAFYGCALETSSIDVKEIGDFAFAENIMKSMIIRKDVASIGIGAFYGCQELESFDVDSENEHFCSWDDGALYDKEKTKLLCLPQKVKTNYVMPESVDTVNPYSVNVKSLYSMSFSNMKSIAPDTVLCGVYSYDGKTKIEDYSEMSMMSFYIDDGKMTMWKLDNVQPPDWTEEREKTTITVSGETNGENVEITVNDQQPIPVTVSEGKFSAEVKLFLEINTIKVTAKHGFAEISTVIHVKYGGSEKMHDLTVTASPQEGGIVAGSGKYISGATASISAAANQGYHFIKWKEDGDTHPLRNVTITEDKKYTAVFEKDRATITVDALLQEGGKVAGGGTYEIGTSVTISAEANPGYHFVRWSDGSTEAVRALTVSDSSVYIAIFEKDRATITVEVSQPGGGRVIGGGTFDVGSQATIVAVADSGYHFVRWSDGSTDAERTVTVTESATYTAVFEKDAAPQDDESLTYIAIGSAAVLVCAGAGALVYFKLR